MQREPITKDGGFLVDLFAVSPETWVALDTASLVTFVSQKYGKNAQKLSCYSPALTLIIYDAGGNILSL